MHNIFCPKCGRTVSKLYSGLCGDCFLEKFSFADKLPDKLLITECRECGRFYLGEKDFHTLEGAIEKFFKGLKFKELHSVTYRVSKDNIHATLHARISGMKKEEEKEISLKHPLVVCKICNMKFSGYFNATLQVRGNVNIDKVSKEIERKVDELKKEDKMAFVSGSAKKRGGIDYYFGSKSAADKVARFLKSRYRTKTKITRTLYGMKEGKKVYRDTILVSFGE
ncbi:MAG: hypothetical protein HYT70_00495 [Candidatus Aenigmarchaeota archaeon]|nr:hypothetical protein [Candidatus Aenigmarchaeota archaeon]